MLSYATGLSALNNAQTSISVTSDNIANTSTQGYRRNTVVQEQGSTINTTYGNLGTGADVTAIARVTNAFIEAQYLAASSEEQKWDICQEKLSTVETLFTQDEEYGLEAILEDFWSSWQDLANDPDSQGAKVVVQSSAQGVVDAIDDLYDGLKEFQNTLTSEINDTVNEVNALSDQIAQLNLAIVADPDNNDLLNERDLAVRDLAELVDISTNTGSDGQMTIMLGEGYPLVEGGYVHELSLGNAQCTSSLLPTSTYEGEMVFSGDSSQEYLIEFVSDGADGTAQFKVSTDGGSSWMSDEDGNTLLFTASDSSDNPTVVGDLEIWFDGGGITEHSAGDQYAIVPKTGLYWEGSTSTVNITPMETDQGEDVDGRLSGGSLAGLFQTRDSYMGDYLQQLDTLAASIIYEVNAVYSQGAGLEGYSAVQGTYDVNDTAAALSESGLAYAAHLSAGEYTLVTYDADGEATMETIAIDPATDSLEDVANAINTAFSGGEIMATVTSEGTLNLKAASDTSFSFGEDSSGVFAALGLNTFFTGTDASNIALHQTIAASAASIHAGSVSDQGLVAAGNNQVALGLVDLSNEPVAMKANDGSTTTQTFQDYLASLVVLVGTDVSTAQTQHASAQSLSTYLYDQQESISGVNLDEELTLLTKYQQEYEAAAQIIQTTQSMIDTLLEMV